MAKRADLAVAGPFDRQPPYAPEAEISVLGSMLIDGDAVPKVIEMLDDNMFYREAHRRIYRAMYRLFCRGEVIEAVTIREELAKTDELDSVGGWPYVCELIDAVVTAANVHYHARIVRDRAQLRRLIEAGSQIIRDGYEPGERSVAEVVDAAGQTLFEAIREDTGPGLTWLKKDLYGVFERIEHLQKSPGGITGLSTGLADLDGMTGGLQVGDMVIIAARPSMGKTSLATTITLHVAIALGLPVAFFSLDTVKQQIIQRMLCTEGRVNLAKLLRGQLTDDDYVRLAQAASHLNTAPIFIDDSSSLGITQLRARVRRMRAEHKDLALVVVDFAQLMDGPGENRNQQLTSISKGLKSIGKETGVPIIALSQLSREVEKRDDKRPHLSDLRESGSLEQDADLVALLYRPEYYFGATKVSGRGKEKKVEDLRGIAELIIGKQRNGPTGSIDLFYRKECVRFENRRNNASGHSAHRLEQEALGI